MSTSMSKYAGEVYLVAREQEAGKAIAGEAADEGDDKKIRDVVKKTQTLLDNISKETQSIAERQEQEIAAHHVTQLEHLGKIETALNRIAELTDEALLKVHLHPEKIRLDLFAEAEKEEQKATKKAAKAGKKTDLGIELPKLE